MAVIGSAHRFTGFWFESELAGRQDVDQEHASEFLSAALNALVQFDRAEGELRGGINSGFDPASLSANQPGYRWLSNRLKWMKDTSDGFDDKPAGRLKAPEQRRSPFPAFNRTIRYPFEGRKVPLEGVQVLGGHDFVVIHEFSVSRLESGELIIGRAAVNEERFAGRPPRSALFTAAFCQFSGDETMPAGDEASNARRAFNRKVNELAFRGESRVSDERWLERDFAAVRHPGFKALRCAVRAAERRYWGYVREVASDNRVGDLSRDLRQQLEDHINATAFLRFFCTLLVNDSKVQYEVDVFDREIRKLKRNLDIRLHDAKGPGEGEYKSAKTSRSKVSLSNLIEGNDADYEWLHRVDHLVLTCQRNADQFGQVASKLMESDNQWIARARRRLASDFHDLCEKQESMWSQFKATKKLLDGRMESQFVSGRRTISRPLVRDQIFISYSHFDDKWLSELLHYLTPIVEAYNSVGLDPEMIWTDRDIKTGEIWESRIKEALARAKVAVLLVSQHFVNSKFIKGVELPELLKVARRGDLMLFWIHVEESTYDTTGLEPLQCAHNVKKPLERFRQTRGAMWIEICKKISNAIKASANQ